MAPYPTYAVGELLAETARKWPDSVALIDATDGTEHTYGQIATAARGLARVMQDDGIQRGDRVGIVAPNSPEWVVAFQAAMIAGATVTTVNPVYREAEIAAQFADSGPSLVFSSPFTAEVAAAASGPATVRSLADVWTLAANASGDPEPVELDPATDLAVLPYSSGTTGRPKGTMLTHANLVANVRQCTGINGAHRFSVGVAFLPLFHIYGMQVIMNTSIALGCTQIVMPRFDLAQVLELVVRHEVTTLYVVPPVVLALSQVDPDKADLSTVETLLSGAAPLPMALAARVEERLGVAVSQGYGMTEASPVTHATLVGRDKPGTVGPPVSDTRQRVVDPLTGDDLGPDEMGELWVQGPQVMVGYLNAPEETAATLIEDDDGVWLRTGDIVTMDDEGYVTIRDRAKEMIKYKGFQIAPAELESVLAQHPGIADAAVVPVPEGEAGDEIPRAFVVLAAGSELTAEEVMAHVESRVAPFKRVRDVVFVDQIPRNLSGKILRRELRDGTAG